VNRKTTEGTRICDLVGSENAAVIRAWKHANIFTGRT